MKKNRKPVNTAEYMEMESAAFYLEEMFCMTANEGNQLLKESVIAAYSKKSPQMYHYTTDDIYFFDYCFLDMSCSV